MAVRWPDDDHDTIEAAHVGELRTWFEVHHDQADGVWIRYWKVGSGRASVTWSETVDELLCFGWIDTKVQSIDDDCYVQYLTHRRVASMWSKVNKAKVLELEATGRMTDAGRAVIERAKADGSWTILDAADARIVPDDLAVALDAAPAARRYYESLTPAQQSSLLRRIYLTKGADTRERWVNESVRRLLANDKPPY